jgi:hypothetical protein
MFSKKITRFRIRPCVTTRLNGKHDQRSALVKNGRGNTVIKFLAPALVMFPLLGGVPMKAATAAPLASYAPLINQTENSAIVKVTENCGNGYFRDGNGHCLYFGYESTSAPAHEGCPPGRHFVHWTNHRGGFCKLN